MFDKFFIEGTYLIDWDYAMDIPEIKAMDGALQSPKWHSEGDVLQHTKKCLNYAYAHIGDTCFDDDLDYKRMLIMTVLLHDVGKPVCATCKDGKWHHYGHEVHSARLVGEILSEYADNYSNEIKTITSLVSLHMKMHKLLEQKDFIEELARISREVDLYDLEFIHYCDVYGSTFADEKEKEKDIERTKLVATLMEMVASNELGTHIPEQYLFRQKKPNG